MNPDGGVEDLAPPLQGVFREAFERARGLYETAARRHARASVEETARRVAWSAVLAEQIAGNSGP